MRLLKLEYLEGPKNLDHLGPGREGCRFRATFDVGTYEVEVGVLAGIPLQIEGVLTVSSSHEFFVQINEVPLRQTKAIQRHLAEEALRLVQRGETSVSFDEYGNPSQSTSSS